MTNINAIENQISAVKKYLKILERYQKYSRREIEENIDVRGALERYLYLMCQAVIDTAESLIAFKNLRKPSSLSENFYVLNEENLIDSELTESLVKMAGFRNIIAHDYDEIDYGIVYQVLHEKLKDVERFLEIASRL